MVKDAIVLVTGGASGIGLATVEQLLENGSGKIYIADINEENGKTVAKSLETRYGNDRVKFLKLDVTNFKEFQNVFETIIKESGRLDIFLNNAGVVVGDKVFDINTIGVFNGLKLAMKFMKKGSKVINTASMAGYESYGESPQYVASKHAVIGLTKSFSNSYWYDKTQISVMAICPGSTETPLFQTIPNNAEYQDLLKISKDPKYRRQMTESVAKSMIIMLKTGKNGSFWIVLDDKLYEIEFPPITNIIKNEVAIQ